MAQSLETEDVAPPRCFASEARADSSEPARILPPSAYSSLAFQAREDAAIWTRVWVAIGFAADVATVGDVLPFTVGTHGIHVERLADGALAGRFNKAQHGGCRAVPLQCQTGSKTKCSFTACGYSRDRGPIGAQDADRAKHLDQYLGLRPERLLPVALRVRGPLILANLDPSRDGRDPLDEAACSDDLADGETIWIEYRANWKHVATALASRGEAGIAGRIQFPNVVTLASPKATVTIVLQPTALDKTLCRLRVFGPATRDMLACIAVRGAVAEELQAGSASPLDAMRWFDARILAAFDVLDRETPAAVLFRTNHKGGW